MASTYKTPGVYIEEIPKFPPSVAAVETAIPVFVGYTQKATSLLTDDLKNKAIRISSFLEYQAYYGEAPSQALSITLDLAGQPVTGTASSPSKFNMYYALRAFYDNGGGPSYIISLGAYPSTGLGTVANYDDSSESSALNVIKKVDEITLLVFPDLASLNSNDQYYTIIKKALLQSGDLKDRFTLIDLYKESSEKLTIDNFRDKIGTSELKFGAAYYPELKSVYNFNSSNSSLTFVHTDNSGKKKPLDSQTFSNVLGLVKNSALKVQIEAALSGVTASNKADRAALISRSTDEFLLYPILAPTTALVATATTDGVRNTLADILLDVNAAANPDTSTDPITGTKLTALSAALALYIDKLNDSIKLAAPSVANSSDAPTGTIKTGSSTANLAIYKNFVTETFIANVKATTAKIFVTIPASPAVAGIYAYVDSTRGVWKAPANVSLNAVVEPTVALNDADQADLNVSDTGKSINAIRKFTGKGVLVWGSRTLAGNDNEWRYVPVRRFFNFVEESVKKATIPFVFEPNDANTWIRVKGMIENFLILQWRAGALAGAKPEDAFYVAVGINKTMTALDILEGRMIVEIGMAVVRPAEFIILRFSHKMQES